MAASVMAPKDFCMQVTRVTPAHLSVATASPPAGAPDKNPDVGEQPPVAPFPAKPLCPCKFSLLHTEAWKLSADSDCRRADTCRARLTFLCQLPLACPGSKCGLCGIEHPHLGKAPQPARPGTGSVTSPVNSSASEPNGLQIRARKVPCEISGRGSV